MLRFCELVPLSRVSRLNTVLEFISGRNRDKKVYIDHIEQDNDYFFDT